MNRIIRSAASLLTAVTLTVAAVPLLSSEVYTSDYTVKANAVGETDCILYENFNAGLSELKDSITSVKFSKPEKTYEESGLGVWGSNVSGVVIDDTLYIFPDTENDKIQVMSAAGMFMGLSSLKSADLTDVDFEYCTDYGDMFSGCSSLENVVLDKNLIISNITSISGMFRDCCSLRYVDLSGFEIEAGMDVADFLGVSGTAKAEDIEVQCSEAVYSVLSGGNAFTGRNAAGITRTEPHIAAQFSGVNLLLDEGLSLKYSVYIKNIPQNSGDIMLGFTRNGSTVEVPNTANGDGTYIFTYDDVNPQCMTDNIDAVLTINDENIAVSENFTVREYCEKVYELYSDDEKTVTLLADLLTYGSEAQKYNNYRLGSLADSGLDWVAENKTKTYTKPESVKSNVTKTGADSGVIRSLEVYAGDNFGLYANVYLSDYQLLGNVVCSINGGDEANLLPLSMNSDGSFKYYLESFAPTMFGDEFLLKITDNSTFTHEVKYSINSFLNSKWDDESMGDLIKAISAYSASAVIYAQ